MFGGIHATLYPDEALDLGAGHAVVKGDGDIAWGLAVRRDRRRSRQALRRWPHRGRRNFLRARWDLLPPGSYMWASVQTVRGCPKHCSFCSVWRTDGQKPRNRSVDVVVNEILGLRRQGFRFIALADDNFYPVTLEDLRMAARRDNPARLEELEAIRAERFELMEALSRLPKDTVFFTQITMEAANDPEFLDAMNRAHIKGALVGVESVTPEGLKDVYKGFNSPAKSWSPVCSSSASTASTCSGRSSSGCQATSPRPSTRLSVAERADVTFAQFVMLTPFPGTLDFAAWEKTQGESPEAVNGIPVTRHWLIPQAVRPKVYIEHPVMSPNEIRERTQGVWDRFYSPRASGSGPRS